MAKINSSGASPSRLVPPGNCNQNANPPVTPDDMPGKMSSTPKSILWNEICDANPIETAAAQSAPSGQSSATRHKFASFAAELSLLSFGNSFLLWPEDP